MFWIRVRRDACSEWAGRPKCLNVSTRCWERATQVHDARPSYPPLALFRLHSAFTSIKASGVAAHHFAWHGIVTITAANAARRACVPCERNLFLSTPETPLPPAHILPRTSACGGACAPPSGMRHEDELVCSLSDDARGPTDRSVRCNGPCTLEKRRCK